MIKDRDGAKAALLSESEWWITGGSGAGPTSEVFMMSQGFTLDTSLPNFMFWHSLVDVGNGSYIIIEDTTHGIWIMDRSTDDNTWIRLPDLPDLRGYRQAGMVLFPDGKRKLVVAGGSGTPYSEIFDLDTQLCRPGIIFSCSIRSSPSH